MRFGIGQPVRRTEDPRFLRGLGRYASDLDLPRQAHMCVVHANVPHADIRAVDTAAARAMPGVLLVLTGADAAADGLGPIPPTMMPEDAGGPPGHRAAMPVLAAERVRYVGERVAIVVAETAAQARDAAETIDVDLAELDFTVDARAAREADAAQLYPEAPANTAFTLRAGDAAACDAAFAGAAHVARVTLTNQRLSACPMEPRACVGDYSPADDSSTLHTSTQNPHGIRTLLAQAVLRVPEARLRVVARDVGGGFGNRTLPYPEDALVLWASRRLGRPVKWVGTRSECLLGDHDGRDQQVEGALALDEDGRFLGLRIRALHNVGAYIVGAGCVPIVFAMRLAQTVYRVPCLDVETSLVFTNLAPTVPYRGAGRPEAVYLVERLVGEAARVSGIDPVGLRRTNLVRAEDMPFTTHTGWTLDSGDFAQVMDRCVALADREGFAARREASAAAGRLRGLGVAYYVDNCGVFNERMELRFDPSGSVTVLTGTFSHGQGHETAFTQLVSAWLGIDADRISVLQGDTAQVAFGRGTYASRSLTVGGSALRAAADRVIEKGKALAGHLLEASPVDIAFEDGRFVVAGTDRALDVETVARAAYRPMGLPPELGVGLDGVGTHEGPPSFPNGCHACEVEVDPETGAVRIERFSVVDDVGTVVNPLLIEGQIQGGVAQGIGQALLEETVHDPGSGQLVSGSFMDYCMPRADDLPDFELDMHGTPCKTNPLGVKGAGEGGTVGATPAVMLAVLDALAPLGVRDLPMPATPQRVWEAIRSAETGP